MLHAKQSAEPSPYDLGMLRLAESGLNGADAKALKLKFLSAEATAALDPAFDSRPSMQLPYFDSNGKQLNFYRIRYLGKAHGFAGATLKPRRYAQPHSTLPELYLPKNLDWKKLLQDVNKSLWITEGEIKAAAACQLGIPCVGLGGVWSWKSIKAGIDFLPALEEFAWAERKVFLAFDSDLRTNPQVLRALISFSKALTKRGAAVCVVNLPDGLAGAKQGLDDFIVAKKKSAASSLAALAVKAVPFSQAEKLLELNTEVVYVVDPGLIVVLETGLKLSPRAFKEHAYSDRKYFEVTIDSSGSPKRTEKPIAPAWLTWEQRAKLKCLTFAPGEGKVTSAGEYNYWDGWGCEPKRGSVVPWKELLDYMFAADPASRKWFEQWCAWPIQNPGGKMYTAAVLWGIQTGTGKSLIGYSLKRIYGTNFAEITDQELSSPFNEWAMGKQLIMGDDVAGSEHKKGTADRLKAMITRQELRLNPKYVPSYSIPDCINYYFNSNHPDAFIVEDMDRRYFIWEAPSDLHSQEFYRAYDAWLNSEAGPQALFYHLLHLDLTGFDPKGRAPETAAKRAMMRDSKSDLADWVHRLKESPAAMLRVGSVELQGDLFSAHRLLALYDPETKGRVTANGMARELKRAGFRQVHGGQLVITPTGTARLYAIRNPDKWLAAGLKDIQAYLAKTAAPTEDKPRKY